ncbi:sensor histidine kinase [Rhizobium sp. LC145]|uniref:sensor histidine kinase n=1 Tax=Rhizobium sp. LC145 TaxID=1120688 RepID=UPI000A67824E|nr:sensor histidine kinase [Rhizobium sp. LC145]
MAIHLVRLDRLLAYWRSQSLARQFLFTGGLVAVAAMLLIGAFVSDLIEQAVTRNSAASTALYVDSVIAPILPDMTTTETLDESVARALDETLTQGTLGTRLLSFKLWRKDGTILYSKDKSLTGKRFEPGEDLRTALSGQMVAEFDQIDNTADIPEQARDLPLLAIYNPVLQPWSGEVVAVIEFYEVANDFERSLRNARLHSWLAVAAATFAFFLALSFIVLGGSRTIEKQRHMLNDRVNELSALLAQNQALNTRVQRASQRTAALNERFLRRVGADLHDGPAQLVAYASLRLDSEAVLDPQTPVDRREREIASIKGSLNEAMREIRNICAGLILPDIESTGLAKMLERVVQAHRDRTGTEVQLSLTDLPQDISHAAKICIYRFVQEALNNGWRHAGGIGQRVVQRLEDNCVVVEVIDTGPGFDPAQVKPASLGLAGLRERVESLGGRFEINSSKRGTTVTMSLNICETEQA